MRVCVSLLLLLLLRLGYLPNIMGNSTSCPLIDVTFFFADGRLNDDFVLVVGFLWSRSVCVCFRSEEIPGLQRFSLD